MKITDFAGFIAILGAGYLVGKDIQVGVDSPTVSGLGGFSWTDILLVIGLLALGWYLAVTLS